MIRKFSLLFFAVLALIAICAWSPWLTQTTAQNRALDSFNHAWESVADGCGMNCKGCGAVSSRRVPFGVRVTLEFACGMLPEDSPEYHRQTTVFVSGFGSVHGLPKP